MTETEWLECDDPSKMLEFLRGKGSERKLRLFAAACTRCFWDHLVMEPSRRAVEVAEQFADGMSDLSTLKDARDAAVVVPRQLAGTKMNYPASAFAAAECAREEAWETATGASSGILDAALPLVAHAPDGQVLEAVDLFRQIQTRLLRDIFGNPFQPVSFDTEWHTSTAVLLAKQMYESRDFSTMPILADALQDAGCDNADILNHCRRPWGHTRGCWVVDLVLEKV
ncbi:MAG: hypothetical protein U0792_02770 [Gemmataceae bacterium]